MKPIRLNIRALALDGKTPLSASAQITYDAQMDSHALAAQGGGPFAKIGVLRMRDLVAHGLIGATDHVYVSWAGHGGKVTSFTVCSYHSAPRGRVSTSPVRQSNPSAGVSQVGPFVLGPSDELVLTSSSKGEQLVTLALLRGTAAEVESMRKPEPDSEPEQPASVASHGAAHELGGADELSVTGLSGLLADPQTPTAHSSSHQNGGSDQLSVTGLSGLLADPQTPTSHVASHQNGGVDELNVAGLSGVLAEPQTPTAHKTSHQNGGSDELDVAGLSGVLADPQIPKPEVVLLTPPTAYLDPSYSQTLTNIGSGANRKPAIWFTDPNTANPGYAFWYVQVPQAYAASGTVTVTIAFCRETSPGPGNISWQVAFHNMVVGNVWSTNSFGSTAIEIVADSGFTHYGQTASAVMNTTSELDGIAAGDVVLVRIGPSGSGDSYTGSRLFMFAQLSFAS
jgi:hypothetical protein